MALDAAAPSRWHFCRAFKACWRAKNRPSSGFSLVGSDLIGNIILAPPPSTEVFLPGFCLHLPEASQEIRLTWLNEQQHNTCDQDTPRAHISYPNSSISPPLSLHYHPIPTPFTLFLVTGHGKLQHFVTVHGLNSTGFVVYCNSPRWVFFLYRGKPRGQLCDVDEQQGLFSGISRS